MKKLRTFAQQQWMELLLLLLEPLFCFGWKCTSPIVMLARYTTVIAGLTAQPEHLDKATLRQISPQAAVPLVWFR